MKRGTRERHREGAEGDGLQKALQSPKHSQPCPTLLPKNKTEQNHHHLLMEGQTLL